MTPRGEACLMLLVLRSYFYTFSWTGQHFRGLNLSFRSAVFKVRDMPPLRGRQRSSGEAQRDKIRTKGEKTFQHVVSNMRSICVGV